MFIECSRYDLKNEIPLGIHDLLQAEVLPQPQSILFGCETQIPFHPSAPSDEMIPNTALYLYYRGRYTHFAECH